MPVTWGRVEMPLGGVSTLTDPVHVLPGKLLTLENARFDKPGGISKRPGYVSRTVNIFSDTPASLSTGLRLAEGTDGEQLLLDVRNLYAWNGTDWVNRGRVGDALVTSSLDYFDAGISASQVDFAYANGIRLLSWAGGEFQHFVSNNSTTLVKSATAIGQVFATGDQLWSIRANGASVEWGRIDTTTANQPAEYTITPAAFAAPALNIGVANGDMVAACPIGSVGLAVAFLDSGDANQLHVSIRLNANPPTQPVAQWDSGEVPDECVAICADLNANRIYVAWSIAGTGIRFAVLNAALGTQIGATITVDNTGEPRQRIAMCPGTTGRVFLAWEHFKGFAGSPPSERLPYVRWCQVTDVPAVVGGAGGIHICSDVAIAAKPYVVNSQVYLPVIHTGAGYGHGLIIQIGNTSTPEALDPSWRGTFAREVAQPDLDDVNEPITRGWVANSVNTADGFYRFPIRSRERFEVAKDNDDAIIIGHTGVRVVASAHELSSRNWCTWGKGMFLAGGRPSWYDGVQCAEHGFAWPPSVNRDTPEDLLNDNTGLFPTLGNFITVQLIWHFQDVNGQIQQSEPSKIFGRAMLALGANDGFIVALRNTLLTDRAPPASSWWSTGITKAVIQTYRTTAGVENPPGTVVTAGGTVFYRTKPYRGFTIPGHGTATVGPNTDVGPPVLTIGDVGSLGELDADIVNNEVLYTTGGILPNVGTPPAEICHSHGNRLWLAGLEEPRDLWFSQPFVEVEGPRFNSALRLRIPEPIFALGTLDDKLIVGTFTSLYVVSGRGPGASGDIDIGFSVERLASDLGCINHRSMVATPLGLMMHTTRGFMLLDRALQLQDIGAPVQGLFSRESVVNVVQGTLVTGQAHVRWVANVFDSELEAVVPVAFVFDYRVGEWSFDRLGVNATVITDSISFGQHTHHAILHIDGRFAEEDLTGTASSETFYEFTAETPWIRLDTLQGWQRVRSVTLLGRRPITAQIPGFYNVFVGYDYNDTYSHTYQITRAQVLAMPTDVFQWKFRLARQKCEAIRLMITDAPNEGAGDGIGFRLSSIVFEAGLKRGTMKLRQEQKS